MVRREGEGKVYTLGYTLFVSHTPKVYKVESSGVMGKYFV